jgi:prevent-host-death family protein
MNQLIPAAEANRSFSRLLREVQGGQSFVITSHGKAVARIVPCDAAEGARNEARERLLARLAARPVTDIGRWSRDELYER